MPSLDQLPVEILLGICHYLDIPDILRIRRVSQYLNKVSYCRDVWASACRTVDFVRPPGPFPLQSARELENALIPSFRVDQHLSPKGGVADSGTSARKLREIQYKGVTLRTSLVFGRYMLIALREEVRCYDLDSFDSDSDASTVYKSAGRFLTSFHCVSATDIDGRPFACVVLGESARGTDRSQVSVYSLNVTRQCGLTLDLIHQLEEDMFSVRSVDPGPRMVVVRGSVSRPVEERCVVLDLHTHTEFLLSLTDSMWETDEILEISALFVSCISTSTHIILARSFYTSPAGWSTVFNAFALPPPKASANSTLSCTHRGIIPNTISDDIVLLHDASLDPRTQEILIVIQLSTPESSRCNIHVLKHGILRLGRSRCDEVGVITFEPLGPLGQYPQNLLDRPSFNGTGRMFYMVPSWTRGVVASFDYTIRNEGGGHDKLGTRVRERSSVLQLPGPRRLLDYDPYRGRLCLQHVTETRSVIEVWDLLSEPSLEWGSDAKKFRGG